MKLAIIFPGQGSQSVGMLSALAEKNPVITDTFAQASDVLGYDLWAITSTGPKEQLDQTAITQPAMLSAGVAVYRLWQESGTVMPSVMAGHSLGEYTAGVCAGALDFADAVKLVAARGELMQEAVPLGSGAMAAILGLADEVVIKICADTDGVVEAVNFNSPGQVVIAGNAAAVTAACDTAKASGAKRALLLPVSVPSHSSLMKPAADKFAKIIAEVTINPPEIPVINNVDAKAEIEPDAIRGALIRQLYNPVRWVDIIKDMKKQGVEVALEAGPGKVLSGLLKRIDKSIPAYPVYDDNSMKIATENIK